MRSAEVAACPRDRIPCVPRSVTIAVGSIADDAAPAIGGLATIDKMSAPAAIDERRRDLVETVMVNSPMRIMQFSTPNYRRSCCHRSIVDACEARHTPAGISVGKRGAA